jgi:hypothetical protein
LRFLAPFRECSIIDLARFSSRHFMFRGTVLE